MKRRAGRKLNVAVVGAHRGKGFARYYQRCPYANLVAICDRNEPLARAAAKELGVEDVCFDFEELLTRIHIDAVCIETGDDAHGPMTIAALEAGKHVHVDVPLATSIRDLRRIVELSEDKKLNVCMGNEVRFWPGIAMVKRLVEQGQLGRVYYAEGDYLNPMLKYRLPEMRWTQSFAGVKISRDCKGAWQPHMNSPGLHALDTIRWVLGGERMVDVRCHNFGPLGPSERDPKKGDGMAALFTGERGTIVKIHVNYNPVRTHLNYHAFYGTKGTYESDRLDEFSGPYLFLDSIEHQSHMMKVPLEMRGVNTKEGHMGADEILTNDFVFSVLEGRQPLVNVREAARSCAATITAQESAWAGAKVMKIPRF